MLALLKIRHLYYPQRLHYLQYNTYTAVQFDTYSTYNRIFVLLTVLFFKGYIYSITDYLQLIYDYIRVLNKTEQGRKDDKKSEKKKKKWDTKKKGKRRERPHS